MQYTAVTAGEPLSSLTDFRLSPDKHESEELFNISYSGRTLVPCRGRYLSVRNRRGYKFVRGLLAFMYGWACGEKDYVADSPWDVSGPAKSDG